MYFKDKYNMYFDTLTIDELQNLTDFQLAILITLPVNKSHRSHGCRSRNFLERTKTRQVRRNNMLLVNNAWVTASVLANSNYSS